MSNPTHLLALTGILLFSLCAAPVASAAYYDYADPPDRVAYLDHTNGDVSYSPAGEDEWVRAMRNRPLIHGDRLWTDRNARAEFLVGSAAIRIGSNTSVEILDLNNRIVQVQLSQGMLNLSVRRMDPGQIFEVDTPALAFVIKRAGRYRIDVDPYYNETTIVVWEGAAKAYGERSSFSLRAGDTVRFYSSDLRDYEMYGMPREDDFDRYSFDRDQRLARSASLRYVDDDMVGYADLDEYGNWRSVRNYGTVWFPSRVSANWAPYRDGHWIWQEPWGWTWVDHAPWGFAPSHYGRWVYISHRWGWIPGPRNVRPVYAPALVAFIGGHGWSLALSRGGSSPIGWFPLGPRDVYVPSYRASRDYFTRVNVNNTVINNTTINNVYNNYASGDINVTQVNYVNRSVAGAVTAVPSTVFVNAQPVEPAAIRLDHKAVTTGETTRVAPIAPNVTSVIGAGTGTSARPAREAFDRRVVAVNAPPPAERPFAAREKQLQKNPGQAVEPNAVEPEQGRSVEPEQGRSVESEQGRSVESEQRRSAEPEQGRTVKTAKNVRVIGEQRDAVEARTAGSRRSVDTTTGTRAAEAGQYRPLDRSAATGNRHGPGTGDRSQDNDHRGQADTQLTADQQQQQAERQAECERLAIEQHQDGSQCRIQVMEQMVTERQAECERQAIEKHLDKRQCLNGTLQQ